MPRVSVFQKAWLGYDAQMATATMPVHLPSEPGARTLIVAIVEADGTIRMADAEVSAEEWSTLRADELARHVLGPAMGAMLRGTE